MSQYSFLDDYSEGCHPDILAALADTNLVQQTAYGNDDYSERARALIREQLGRRDTPVYFVSGGTLANIIITASALRPHEAIIAASTGHIVGRETGAIEAAGHKIITVATADGKLTPEDIRSALANNAHYPHMAKPRLVYISNATELGTVYTRAELRALAESCRANDLLLMLDGARLGVALTTEASDLTLAEIADLTDIFWIGGTKAGALIGEAIVIPNAQLAHEFDFHIKQRGALLAKGRLLGLQFATLFSGQLFFALSAHANAMAQKISRAITASGYALASPTQSNMIFPILPDALLEKLHQDYEFHLWSKADDEHAVIRLVTSWATDEEQVNAFIRDISEK
ncbi:aminotransferase class I/II-fold pyridoxal phosphate-dependent enzyme [Microbulbifer sp. SAOS-129_SWC]|uniref:threonine aldolase family protein n=1 Tax=Microbulbifer sp. SAOS-129_SWC TaxID=3145235 RepID=UPI00321733E5